MVETADTIRSIAGGGGRFGTSRIFAVTNQKGGVGKTTTAINLGAALASVGRRVLVIDLDPQGNASTGLGVAVQDRRSSSYSVLLGEETIGGAAMGSKTVPNLWIIPSTRHLSGADADLMKESDGRYRLRDALRAHVADPSGVEQQFDYVLIDCPPSLNLLGVNALTAAHGVLAPLQCEFFALEGVSQLVSTIKKIREALNPELSVQGVVLTMYDKRQRSCEEVADEVRNFFGDLVYETVVPRNGKLAEAPSFGLPALMHDPDCSGSQAYIALATEVLERENDPIQ